MTLSDALKLPAGRELDAVVCEHLGYELSQRGGHYRIKPDNWTPVPNYSTDLSAAWTLVEKLREKWGVCRIEVSVKYAHVEFCQPSHEVQGMAETLPLAIARAALRVFWKDQ